MTDRRSGFYSQEQVQKLCQEAILDLKITIYQNHKMIDMTKKSFIKLIQDYIIFNKKRKYGTALWINGADYRKFCLLSGFTRDGVFHETPIMQLRRVGYVGYFDNPKVKVFSDFYLDKAIFHKDFESRIPQISLIFDLHPKMIEVDKALQHVQETQEIQTADEDNKSLQTSEVSTA